MNRLFDFSPLQLKFLSIMTGIAVLLGGWLMVKAVSSPQQDSTPIKVFIGENEQIFTGVFVIDPNTAPADSLELLPGIGLILADRIVEYRKNHQFNKAVDLTSVNGIGAKTFEKLRPYLRIRR
ncbi:MAG: helix-hairpin-helix domain-containing protein [candidate division Zixibacteria bacterium]|nr:helix-hairpin-helix domain-containing protein [candidate division Zixibacteria bacterium]